MKKLKFKTQWNAKEFPRKREYNTGELVTVPNQSLTVSQIYERYASGRSLSGVEGNYDDDGTGKINLEFDDYMPDLNTLDLADRQEVIENAKMELEAVKRRLDGIAKARKLRQSQKEKELLDKIKKLEEKQSPPPAPSAGGDVD